MARYKHIDTSSRFLAVDLERQLHPGTFEHALNYLADHELDLRRFDARYTNDTQRFLTMVTWCPGLDKRRFLVCVLTFRIVEHEKSEPEPVSLKLEAILLSASRSWDEDSHCT